MTHDYISVWDEVFILH